MLSSETSLESLEFLLLLFVPNMFARFRKIVERPRPLLSLGGRRYEIHSPKLRTNGPTKKKKKRLD